MSATKRRPRAASSSSGARPAVQPFTGRYPSCGSLEVEPSDDSQRGDVSWTCWACNDAWGVRRGLIV